MKSQSVSPRPARRALLVCGGIALILLALVLVRLPRGQAPGELPAGSPGRASTRPPAGEKPGEAAADKSTAATPAEKRVKPVNGEIRRILEALQKVSTDAALSPAEKETRARGLLAELREALRSAEPDAATAAILAFLETGEDARTGLGFTLEAGGIMEDAPSLRTALLDLLGQFDPIAAADYSERIFGISKVPDEWALALRNLGWQNQDGSRTAQIREHFTEMLQNSAWLRQPSEGFLQALDTAVHLGSTVELRAMAQLVMPVDENDRPAGTGITHGAYLAVDRITVQNPLQTLTALTGDPDLMAGAPQHRAALLARADVSQPDQRALLEGYLATLANRPNELETFTALFPNRNGSLSNNLITTPPAGDGPSTRDLDAAALSVVRGWLASGNYPALDGNLRTISDRLTRFVDGDAS